MEKILVTTNQSTNAKSAIRFAVNLANVRKATLTVLHVYNLMKPFIWTEEDFDNYRKSYVAKVEAEIKLMVRKITKSMDRQDIDFDVAMVSNIDVTDGIIEYIEKKPVTYLCIGTKGAGFVTKIFGTNASKLIERSSIPVICIPLAYRNRRFRKVLYATDLTNYESELVRVIDFVRPMGTELSMVHIAEVDGQKPDGTIIEAAIQKNLNYKVALFSRKWDMSSAILKGIREEAVRYKPSAIVFFSHQSRSFLDKLLLPSNASELSFYSKIPIISFRK